MTAAGIADQFLDALSHYDVAALDEMLSDDFVRWLNLDGEEQGRAVLLAIVELERGHVTGASFEVRSRVATDEGFVCQLTAAGTTIGGTPYSIPVCLVVTVVGDRITRIDEYVSSDHVAPLLQELLGDAGT